ncbi:MAG: PAS domain S-box protein [Acidobacteria bacterium]|nr:PAS domain S-box protein [Acidobacteriota bacterium]
MGRSYQTRIVAITLSVLTLAACILAGLNISRERNFDTPTDGVRWVEVDGGLQALRVPAESPAYRAGVRTDDILIAVNESRTERLPQLVRQMFRSGSYGSVTYTLVRKVKGAAHGERARLDVKVILGSTDRTVSNGILRLIALIYLSIGLYVLFRRWTAPKSTHFYVFCLASFVLYAFKYTGQLDGLDWTFYWGNLIAIAIQPALFLHFAITFTEGATLRRRTASALLYIPGLFLIGLQIVAIHFWQATELLRHRLDQIGTGYLDFYYVLAAATFLVSYRRSHQPLERQQLKLLTRGTLLSILPFTCLYVIPYLSEIAVRPTVTNLATLMLVFIPLTFSWAIVRYRMMDTDLIFKRGVTYTLATAALVGVYFGIVAISAEVVHTRLPSLRVWGLLAAIIATALIFDPIKTTIQARVDRIFDRKRYDYRETLIEFSRSLSSETDLAALAQSIVERLSQTLLVSSVGVFLLPSGEDGRTDAEIIASIGVPPASLEQLPPLVANASFLRFESYEEEHRFFENPQSMMRLPDEERKAAALLDMTYFLPCRVAQRKGESSRVIAVIGLGRTQDGDFLSSEDMELLESLAGYVGIAIQNAQLFRRLESKIGEFERLKEFNENIVESIKVGIFTLDLEDRIESWNAEMEVMYALSRGEVVGKRLSDVFPAEFVSEFDRLRDETGPHQLTKMKLPMLTGETRTANIAVAPLLTRDFVSVGRIVLVEDITERTALEAQLTQAEKLSSIGMLAAGVAHEVNTPLAVISSYTQMLTKHAAGDGKLAPVLEKITQQTFRASEIVNGLLNFSRKTATEFSALNLNTIVRETCTLLEHQFRSARVKVVTELDPNLPTIEGSQGKLQQVILNLMMNARDAMADVESPTLTVRSETNAYGVTLSIQDNGAGIEPAHLHRIYDPFFTTKNAPREGRHKGTGLGLAVSYGIVQEHGGRIRVESAVGAGTTFFLDFPLTSSRGAHEPSAERTMHV